MSKQGTGQITEPGKQERLVSVCQRLFIMKLHTNDYQINKQASLEEGSLRYETIMDNDSKINPDQHSSRCNQCLQIVKVILYLELILFIGWIGCTFVTNYYQIHNNNGLNEPYSSSEWSRGADDLDSAMDSNSVSSDAIKWSPYREATKTTTDVKSETFIESVDNKKSVISSEMEPSTVTDVVKPENTEVESMLLSSWLLQSLKVPKNTEDENSSKLTSSEHNFHWDTSSNDEWAIDVRSDETSSSEHHFGMINKHDEIDLNYILTLPIWRDVILTPDYLDEMTNSDKDTEDLIAKERLVFTSQNLMDNHQSRQVRSIIGQEEDNSSSSSSEESTTAEGESRHSNSTSGGEDECPTILDDEGNVIDKPNDVVNYIGKNWVRWFAKTDIPECEKPKVVESVTVDKCGRFVVNCVLETSHNRDTRSVEVNKTTEEKCKRVAVKSQKDFEAWKANLVKGEASDPMVQNIYSEIERHVFALILPSIAERLDGGQLKTDEQWRKSALTMKSSIHQLLDSEHKHLLAADSEVTLKTGSDLRQLVETGVDIYMNCRDVLMPPPQARVLTMLVERERCCQGFKRVIAMENAFAAEIVPGESTNPNIMAVREKFKKNVLSLIIRMEQDERQDPLTVPTVSVNVTDEQWTSYTLGLKQEIAKFPKDPTLQQQLENAVYPTQEQTNQLREIAEFYLREYVKCTLLTLFGLMGALRDVELYNNHTERSVSRLLVH